ncbi:hypothetical protein PFICI_00534 [Pestalotiopsis fici W106-1]|uniref:Transcription factor domain-containing protein n=1 Tax=Pestalotiopsis fici (strain W106-1 / CGMCC3.15140) TaxID=1229662 RepID=W3XN58_PESFW|nr:uncharacterized protein PFICI_00534 [Pestalotiopsis fici W106-1]ETS86706.1 hypothetical protein PFICI_00534 [Pestalotiopsis fici W106-1]
MDHFNITIQDGAMISTRRGFKVSKQKHNGTAFINSSASNIAPTGTESTSGSLLPTAGELTFVNNGGDGRKSRRKTRTTTQDGRKTGSRSSARGNAHSRISPGTRLSSSSPRTTVSDTFNSEQSSSACSADSLKPSEPTPLPPWAAYSHHSQVRIDPAKRLRFMALAFGHNKPSHAEDLCPPGETKPAGIIEKSTWQVHDPTTIHCALTMGALFDAVKEGRHETPQLTSLASQLYSIVNRRVSENDRTDKARDVTIRAVASLAIISGYQGKSEHWNVHMQGLLNLVDIAGGQERLFPGTLDVIRCFPLFSADIIGALSAATEPRTAFVGTPCKARYISKLDASGNTVRTVYRSFEAFKFETEMVETLAATAKFCEEHAAKQDQDPSPFQHYGPEMFEDFHFLSRRLLTIPKRLQEYDEVISPPASADISVHARPFPISESAHIWPPDTTTKAVETALRILVLMYLKELMLDVPCNDRILLGLLAKHLLFILSAQRLNPFGTDQIPVLVWICLAGQLFGMMKKTVWLREAIGGHGICDQLLREVLQFDETLTLGSVSEEQLAFSKCLDLRRIQGTWHENEAIRGMLGLNTDQ